MSDMEEQLLGDFTCLDPTYVDGIAGLLNLGANFATLYFRWTPIKSEGGGLIYQRSAAMFVVRPMTSIAEEGQNRATLAQQVPPRENIVRMTGTH